MVDLLTLVTPERGLARCRARELAAALGALGFERRPGGGGAFASTDVEAGAVKRQLLARGFRDREFRVVLEYVRQWGVL
jgi:hypothetical protein